MKQYYVYILKCSDNSYYTGVSNNIERRLEEHIKGLNRSSYTFKKRPLELVFHMLFDSVIQAIAFEKQVKGWRRKKKEAIIENNWDVLKKLAICKNDSISNGQSLRLAQGDISGCMKRGF